MLVRLSRRSFARSLGSGLGAALLSRTGGAAPPPARRFSWYEPLRDPEVTEIMVAGPERVFVERDG